MIAICGALDNVPLALELAAARLRVLTPTVLMERLDHALPLLVGGARDLPERQRTLRATIEWSAQLLSDAERELLLRLGVFRAGFGLDAVEWMSDGLSGVDAVGALGALVDGSLVREQDRGPRAWFTMLATVREYGRDRLAEQGALAESQQRHADFYVGLATAAGSAPTWQGQVERGDATPRRARRGAGGGRPPLRDASVRRRRRAGVAALLVLVGRRARRRGPRRG